MSTLRAEGAPGPCVSTDSCSAVHPQLRATAVWIGKNGMVAVALVVGTTALVKVTCWCLAEMEKLTRMEIAERSFLYTTDA